MSDDKQISANRDAKRAAHDYTQFSEGQWIGEVGKVGEKTSYPIADELLRRYEQHSKDLRACPHLQANADQPKFWVEAIPELLACRDCTAALAAEEQARANSRCVLCGEHVPLRGVTVNAGSFVLRGGLCKSCEVDAGLPPLPG